MSHSPSNPPEHPIVFFDGVCGLCNRFVDWLLVRDKNHIFRFAPLQGSTAQSLLGLTNIVNPSSVILLADGTRTEKAAAVAGILRRLGGSWAAIGTLVAWTPGGLANPVYDLVASRRYQIFGKRAACRLPSVAERSLFFD